MSAHRAGNKYHPAGANIFQKGKLMLLLSFCWFTLSFHSSQHHSQKEGWNSSCLCCCCDVQKYNGHLRATVPLCAILRTVRPSEGSVYEKEHPCFSAGQTITSFILISPLLLFNTRGHYSQFHLLSLLNIWLTPVLLFLITFPLKQLGGDFVCFESSLLPSCAAGAEENDWALLLWQTTEG